MNVWVLLLLSVTLGSVISLIGGIYLAYGKKGAGKLQRYAVPFAAGALLAATFFDLLPESLEGESPAQEILAWTLGGFLLFFLLEHLLRWFHHHQHEDHEHANRTLIVVGDTLHNFIDGLALGAAFLVSPVTGVAITVAVAVHEIPQEIGDFALLLSKGMQRKKVLLINLFSALATVVGAVIVFGTGQRIDLPIEQMLALTAGFFIYIAGSDVVPSIHKQPSRRYANTQAIILLLGVVLVMITSQLAHQYIEVAQTTHSHQE